MSGDRKNAKTQRDQAGNVLAPALAPLEIHGSLHRYLKSASREPLERALSSYIPRCRWFRSKARNVSGVRVAGAMPVGESCLTMVEVEFAEGEPELYVVPLAIIPGERAFEVRTHDPERAIASVTTERCRNEEKILCDAVADRAFCLELLEDIAQCRRLRDGENEIVAARTSAFAGLYCDDKAMLEPRVLRGEQSNTSIIFGERLILKLFRRLDAGVNPDLEIGRFLTEKAGSINVPPLAGWMEYQAQGAEARTVAMLQGFTANRGDAWTYTLNELRQYMMRALSASDAPGIPAVSIVEMAASYNPEPMMRELAGSYLDAASLMGRRVAELHLALSADPDDPAFAPEPFSTIDQRASYETMCDLQGRVFKSLTDRLNTLNPQACTQAQLIVANQNRISDCFESYLACNVTVPKMRSHGDLHLGQMLYTGDDFVIIDFEGEPARPLTERRRKGICLRDVAGMLRSFDYAAMSVLAEHAGSEDSDRAAMMRRRWAQLWTAWTSWAFLRAYTDRANDAPFIPRDRNEFKVLLDALLIEKAVYELGYELNNRPDWVEVPIRGIMRIIGIREGATG